MIGKDIAYAASLLAEGKLVAIPTETVYGLAGNAYLPDSVAAIFKVKQRPQFDPLILHTDTLEKIEKLVGEFPPEASILAKALWPGPLTLVLPRAPHIHDLVTSGLDTVAVRIPAHPMTLSLLSQLEFPVAAPSANPFTYISPTRPEHVQQQLGAKIPYILDGGSCRVGVESTIVAFPNGIPTVLRKGGTSIETLQGLVPHIQVNTHSSSKPQAPGMLDKHYSPRKKMILGNIPQLLDSYPNASLLTFQDNYGITEDRVWVLSEKGDLQEAAQRLFEGMRALDASDTDLILVELLPEKGLGVAINDRLRRAASTE